MGYRAYAEMRDSGVAWLGDIPSHWKVKRLKFAATVQPSNVDKKTEDGELPVQLCNYADVYKNEKIIRGLSFMQATATPEEIEKFRVSEGDVIVTKDSETPDDIAVPAYVSESLDNVVCGYHLTQIKPREVAGSFLFRLFQSSCFNAQFVVGANGVTRFGLPQYVINDAAICLPSPEEQQTIARFLDHKTAQIDALIAKKQTLLQKLAEKRTALISRAVTQGLDSTVPMKDSGIAWIGKIPVHWTLPPLYARYSVELGKMLNESRIVGDNLVPYLRNTDVQWDSINTDDLPMMDIRPDEYARYLVAPGDLLVCEGGEVGRTAIVGATERLLGFQKALHRLRTMASDEAPRFLYYVLYRAANMGMFLAEGNPNTIPHLTGDTLRRYRFPKPPKDEQVEIARYLDRISTRIERQQQKAMAAIAKLKEYRSALITTSVTGKIDVRDVPLPAKACP